MQAIIMAAGKGVRMLPLTQDTPKPLLMVSGQAILERTIHQLPDSIDEIIIVVGYLKDKIKKFVSEKFPEKNIKYVDDDHMQGTGFAVYACRDLMHGKFLVINGDDLYSKEDLEKLIRHDQAMLCIKLPKAPEYVRFGRIKTDQDGNYEGIGTESDSSWVNTGAYVLTTEIFKVPLVKMKSGEFGLPHTITSMVKDYGKRVGIAEATFWVSIGHPEDIGKAEETLAKQK
jgi:UDP-N-acetylglucosamine diphosphorylase / glucose-1-phosphate thymidylyltransferase / UDP-N-acetylgalactosamine diphosphorylase / glucosamine-1-phosphate N-acetyltransferase / galactosamine-1-phosphate N-acetyltransferase